MDKEIEDRLNDYDFEDDENLVHTRAQMRELLIKQKNCSHEFHAVYKQDFISALRCGKCKLQIYP